MRCGALLLTARYFQLSCCLSIVLLFEASCGNPAATRQTAVQAEKTPAGGCNIEVDWAILYRSLAQLKRAPVLDLAVQGTFTNVLNTQGQVNPTGGSNGPISTNFTFTASKVLMDPHHLLKNASASLTIHQTGGWFGSTLHQVCGDPLFQIGEAGILFLHQFNPGQYFVIGGPSGRFSVHQGFVQSANSEGVLLPPQLTEQQFEVLLQKA